jgi:histidinol-phosphate phosphatase family protein
MAEQAVILCGGLGTRLGSAAGDLPKPMVEVGGKPVLRHAVDRLREAGIREVLCAAGYRADVISAYFARNDCGLQVDVIAEEQPLGTAGSARALLSRLADRFVVVYGDVFIDFDLAELIDADRQRAKAATLLVRPSDHPWDSDLVIVDEAWTITGFIRASEPREFPRNLANAAVYVVGHEVLQVIPEGIKADWVKDVFPTALRRGLSLAAHPFSGKGFIKDMGTPQRLEAVRAYLRDRDRVEQARCHRLPVRAVFLDRDGVINEEVDLLDDPADLRLLPGVASAIRRLNERGMKVVVITNQPVIARGLCTVDDLERIHARLREMLASEGAHIDAIYFCPHHPETHHRDSRSVRELRVACECRKPAPGTLLRATRELGIDLAESIFVGDRATDVEAARRAGVRSVFVGASLPEKCQPDHIFSSLEQTVNEMLAGHLGDLA